VGGEGWEQVQASFQRQTKTLDGLFDKDNGTLADAEWFVPYHRWETLALMGRALVAAGSGFAEKTEMGRCLVFC